MIYTQALQIRHMAERIARTLGQTHKADIIDPDDSYTYNDGVIRILDRQDYLDLSVKNEAGYMVLGLAIGGLYCRGNDEALSLRLDHIRGLYIASHFIQPIQTPIEFGAN